MERETLILGGGVTGLAAGWASGLPVYEAEDEPGGICRSYYVRPGSPDRLSQSPPDGAAYRFELGGGHWIFGGDPMVSSFLASLTPMRSYRRLASVYFPDRRLYVPYPLQYHLSLLGAEVAAHALEEMRNSSPAAAGTLAEWLEQTFGRTLTGLFFGPFHEAYTAGLWTSIAPQDGYKTPVDLALAARGAAGGSEQAGYNTTFQYPVQGLEILTGAIARACRVRYRHRVTAVDPDRREVFFEGRDPVVFDRLISTLPLNRMLDLAGLSVPGQPDPSTSVLVLNIGGVRGPECPPDHWLYIPRSRSGFYRAGVYSNVDDHFLPRGTENRVSFYVERAFQDGRRPCGREIDAYSRNVVAELRDWGFLGDVEAVSPTWVDVAYTWSRPGSRWKEQALELLASRGIFMTGRYGRWRFQGIADSIRDGFLAGASFARREPLSPEGR